MDYSLLLGVHDCELAEQENKERLEHPERKLHVYLKFSNLLVHSFTPMQRGWFNESWLNKLNSKTSLLETEFATVVEDSYNEDDEDSCGSTVGVGGATGPTPPDSPQIGREKIRRGCSLSQQYPYQYTGKIIPELDIYAIPCKEGKFALSIQLFLAK